MTIAPPHSAEAEKAVLGRVMAQGQKTAAEVVTLLQPSHFFSPANRLIYESVYEAYYGDEPLDALTVGQLCAKRLSALWECEEGEAVGRVRNMAEGQSFGGEVADHAKLIKRTSDYRMLLKLGASIEEAVSSEEHGPEQIAGIVSQKAMEIATNTLKAHEIKSLGDLGREFINDMKARIAAREAGAQLGAYFDIKAFDDQLHGLQPTELLFLGGLPGEGKTAVAAVAAMNFARKQMGQPVERRVGTLFLSLEMGEMPSKMRLAHILTGIDSGRFRDGAISEAELQVVLNKWASEQDIPLYFDFTSHLRASQLRAIVTEAIRRHNIGLVVIDHFRHFRMDRRYQSNNEEDDDKVLFLKEQLCKDLNIAVMCLAHTTKFNTGTDRGRRPVMGDLRGSGQIAANADFVTFLYRPFEHADEADRDSGAVREDMAELIWAKSRFGSGGAEDLPFDLARMQLG